MVVRKVRTAVHCCSSPVAMSIEGACSMGANSQSLDLAAWLEREVEFKQRGFATACGPTGGVVVDRWGHVRGVWHFVGKSYFWTPAGYNEPNYRTETIEAAFRYTLDVVGKT